MRVVDLWRYPVKSLQGERLDAANLDHQGLVGDRRWAITDRETGLVVTGRRSPALLFGSPRLVSDGVEVRDAEGRLLGDDSALSAWLGREVRLDAAEPQRAGTYENPLDAEAETDWVRWQGPAGTFHDSTRTQVSILATGDLRGWDVRRFRPNVVVEASTADVLQGATLQVGGATLVVVKAIDRCVMVTRPQPGGLERDLDVLRTVVRERATFLGVGAMVVKPGPICVGDEVEIVAAA